MLQNRGVLKSWWRVQTRCYHNLHRIAKKVRHKLLGTSVFLLHWPFGCLRYFKLRINCRTPYDVEHNTASAVSRISFNGETLQGAESNGFSFCFGQFCYDLSDFKIKNVQQLVELPHSIGIKLEGLGLWSKGPLHHCMFSRGPDCSYLCNLT